MKKIYTLLIFSLLTVANILAADIYVSDTGNDTTGDGSQGSPYATIKIAYDNATTGDKIILVGSITETLQTEINNKNLTFEGQAGARITRSNTGRLINIIGTATVTFSNIIFENLNAGFQGVVVNTTSNTVNLTFTDCLFQNNVGTVQNGNVVHIGNADATFTRCTFYNNTATASNGRGAAIIFGGSFTGIIQNCTFYNNRLTTNTTDGIGAAVISFTGSPQQLTITNSLFANNTNADGDKIDIQYPSDNLSIVNSIAEGTNINNLTNNSSTNSNLSANLTNTTFSFVSPNVTFGAPSSINDVTPIDFGNNNSDVGAWDSKINLFKAGSDWATGTWSSTAVPTSTENVTILSDSPALTIAGTTNAVCNNLSVNASSSLTINAGGTLIVNGTSSGNVTYNRALGTTNWYLVSSPFAGEDMTDMRANNNFANGTPPNIGFASYTSATNQWSYFSNSATDALTVGQGYSAKLASSGNLSFTGTINTSDVSVAVSIAGSGFNLIGNPFTAALNTEAFFDANGANLVAKTIWVWNQATPPSGAYETHNSVTAFILAPTQGFFVRSSNGTNVSINESMQTTGGTFQKSNKSEVKLMMNDGTADRFARIFYLDNIATKGYDNGYDGETFGGQPNAVDVFTHLLENSVGKNFQIQSLPKADMENTIVPVGVKAAAGKELTFTAEAMNLPNGLKVFLEDRQTNTFTELTSTSNYKVTIANALDGIGRFYIHTASSALSTTDVALDNVNIYTTSKNNIRITGVNSDATVKVFNILGKQVLESSFNSKGVSDIAIPTVNTGVYIIQLTTAEGKLNKKIVLE